MSEPPFSRIGIVGLGLIGGSVALGARRAWPDVTLSGLDRSTATANAARGRVVDEVVDRLPALADCDLIVLAIPPSAVIDLMPVLAALDTNAVVTDVASTKRQVIDAAAMAGVRRFVGGHPMGGSEGAGLGHARADLFERRPWLLVAKDVNLETSSRLERFVSGVGGVPYWVDAATHDRTVAYVSHLPQLLAIALMNSASDAIGDRGLAVAGRAFGEMTRLASSPPDLWRDILASNADFVAEALQRFIDRLPKDVDLGEGRWVGDAFAEAARSRGLIGELRSKRDDLE